MPMQHFFRHPLAERVREEGREQGRIEGRIEVRVETTLKILRWRGIHVPAEVRARVESCSDLDQLAIWAQRAVHATDAAELFVETGDAVT